MKGKVGSRIALASVLALGLALTACSSGGGGGETPSTGGGGGGGGTSVTIQNFAFQPDSLTLPAGKVTLSVTNNDSVAHSFTLDDGSVTQDIQPGATEQVTITVPSSGTLGWHCRFHSQMTGTITVG
jgi:plastocyanin